MEINNLIEYNKNYELENILLKDRERLENENKSMK